MSEDSIEKYADIICDRYRERIAEYEGYGDV